MFEIKLLKKKKVAAKTWQFIFVRPKKFIFEPGQFTTVLLGKENRDFTICADANNKEIFSIVTKLGVSTFKKTLFALPQNSKILMSKPSGGFTLQKSKTPKVFLAGGIGMTVFFTIISSNKTIKIPMTLIASFSKKEDIIFQKELEQTQNKNKFINVIYTFSQDNRGNEKGRISKKIIQKYVPNFQKVEYMIAGGEKMVEDTEKLLHGMKIPEENIRIDIFTGY